MGRESGGSEKRKNDGAEKSRNKGLRHGWLLDAQGMVAE